MRVPKWERERREERFNRWMDRIMGLPFLLMFLYVMSQIIWIFFEPFFGGK